MVRLVQFEIQNFRTIHHLQREIVAVGGKELTGHDYVTPFRIKPRPGLNLLMGPNGVGKSNILSAINFALTPSEWAAGRDNRNRGTTQRSIEITTTWHADPALLDGLSEDTRSLKFMQSKDGVAIRRNFRQVFSKDDSRVSITFDFANHQKGEVDALTGGLQDLEDFCVRGHHLLSIETMPSWSTEGLRIVGEAEQLGVPANQLFNRFSTIVNEELLLQINFATVSPDSYQDLLRLFDDTVDRFGENPLVNQGKGVQAVLVYALVISLVRTLGSANNRHGFTLLLDEPENGLHIDLQRHLSGALSKCVEFDPTFTAIITTNSPFLIPQNSDGRVFEIEESDGATIRKNFRVDGEVARHWLESDQSVTAALVGLLGSKSIARVIELFRKSEFDGASEILIVEGYTDRLYIEAASRCAGTPAGQYRIMVAGENLEIRDENNQEDGGVFLLALQVLLAYGWANSSTKIWAIADSDINGLQTLDALSHLTSEVHNKIRKSLTGSEDLIDIKLSNTNRAVEAWSQNFPIKSKRFIPGAVWIETEIEDLFPMEYLDKYFHQAPSDCCEPRRMSILTESKDGALAWSPMTDDMREQKLPATLHNFVLTDKAKKTSPEINGTFPQFLEASPPTRKEAEEFLARLHRMLESEHKVTGNLIFNI